jgi:Ca-activated chloride channel family protein
VLKDVQEHTGSTAVEKPAQVAVAKPAEVLDGVGIDSAPPLRGYIRYITKPTADTILTVDEKDPLLVRWQYGLGRVVVFTSDAKSRWATSWLAWNGFDRLWANVTRDLLPRAQSSEAQAELDNSSDDMVINYHLTRNTDEPASIPAIYALGPNGFRAPLKVTKATAGSYRGVVHIGRNQGLFRVRPLIESRAFPEIGFYRPEDEMTDHSSDELLLRQIAKSTGGRFNPPVKDVFDAAGRAVPSSMELWPGLLALALLLNLIELISRKWKGLIESFQRSAAPASPANP